MKIPNKTQWKKALAKARRKWDNVKLAGELLHFRYDSCPFCVLLGVKEHIQADREKRCENCLFSPGKEVGDYDCPCGYFCAAIDILVERHRKGEKTPEDKVRNIKAYAKKVFNRLEARLEERYRFANRSDYHRFLKNEKEEQEACQGAG